MFVVFEGIDGSGKTTVSTGWPSACAPAGLTVEHLREGGKFSSRSPRPCASSGATSATWS